MSSPSKMTRVLIVDDEPESRTRLRALLQAHGHVVSEATNGLDALEQARQQPPDLVISDILMPQMDGFALCRASRTDPALARTPFVFYTGTYASAKDVAHARRLGATRFLVKSMAAEEVIRAITEALRQPEEARPGGRRARARRDRIVAPVRRVAHQQAGAPQPRTLRRGAGPPLADRRARTAARDRQPHRHPRAHHLREPPVRGSHRVQPRHGARPDARHPAHAGTPRRAWASRFAPRCWPARNGAASSSSAGRTARSSGSVR